MSEHLEFTATQYRLLGRSCEIAAARSEWIFEQIAENFRRGGDFVRIEIEVYQSDESVDPGDSLTTIDTFPYWDEKSGLRVENWPSWFLARLVRYARTSCHRILPGPRFRPLIAGPQQAHIWPEDETFLPPRKEIRKLARRKTSVPLFKRPEEVPGLRKILEDLRG